jgi:hypothetical protein
MLGLGTVEHILGVIEAEFKKKQEENEKLKIEAKEKREIFQKRQWKSSLLLLVEIHLMIKKC